ncbi:MAG: OmpH family outer membrane protein [Rubritepida sp.]|nr:OmpH family outer membrane protein [Rubritepida sp.]
MTFPRFVLVLLCGVLPTGALAQQQQEWFVPGQGQGQRPAQAQQQQQQRPPQQQQRPPQQQQQARPPAPGTPPPAPVIGIVDIPEVQRVSTAFAQVRDEIERRRTRLNEDLQREQNTWRDAQQQLANLRAQLTPDQIRSRERELQERITDSQRIFRNRSQAIEQAAQQALMQIEESLANVVRTVAQSRNINLVLPRPLVIMNDPGFDITEDVAQQFNRAMRTVNIPPETDGVAAPAPAQPAAQRPPAQQAPRRN